VSEMLVKSVDTLQRILEGLPAFTKRQRA
jgi:hypothetical protein